MIARSGAQAAGGAHPGDDGGQDAQVAIPGSAGTHAVDQGRVHEPHPMLCRGHSLADDAVNLLEDWHHLGHAEVQVDRVLVRDVEECAVAVRFTHRLTSVSGDDFVQHDMLL